MTEQLTISRDWTDNLYDTKYFTLEYLMGLMVCMGMDSMDFTEFITGYNTDSYTDTSCNIMEDIYMKLLDYDSERINFIYTDDNSKDLIGRISINCDTDTDEIINGIQDQSDMISIIKNINEDISNNLIIKGISNISDIICITSRILIISF